MSTENCVQVTPQCPIEATTYGYYPDLAGNTILCVVFGICAVLQLLFSIRGRTWTWAIALVLGCLLEMLGYIGRILLHYNPWDRDAYKIQVITLILAPSFLAGGIDLTLKHLVIRFGTSYSLLKPALYTWLFIILDAFCFVLQGAGGGVAAGAGSNQDLANIGNDIILAGVALQVVQLVAFGLVSGFYAFRVIRARREDGDEKSATPVPQRLRAFMACVAIAYTAILIRCIYRIPEMAAGWGKGLQRNEVDFMVLDGTMIAIASIVLTVGHPAFCFPEMGSSRQSKTVEDSDC